MINSRTSWVVLFLLIPVLAAVSESPNIGMHSYGNCSQSLPLRHFVNESVAFREPEISYNSSLDKLLIVLPFSADFSAELFEMPVFKAHITDNSAIIPCITTPTSTNVGVHCTAPPNTGSEITLHLQVWRGHCLTFNTLPASAIPSSFQSFTAFPSTAKTYLSYIDTPAILKATDLLEPVRNLEWKFDLSPLPLVADRSQLPLCSNVDTFHSGIWLPLAETSPVYTLIDDYQTYITDKSHGCAAKTKEHVSRDWMRYEPGNCRLPLLSSTDISSKMKAKLRRKPHFAFFGDSLVRQMYRTFAATIMDMPKCILKIESFPHTSLSDTDFNITYYFPPVVDYLTDDAMEPAIEKHLMEMFSNSIGPDVIFVKIGFWDAVHRNESRVIPILKQQLTQFIDFAEANGSKIVFCIGTAFDHRSVNRKLLLGPTIRVQEALLEHLAANHSSTPVINLFEMTLAQGNRTYDGTHMPPDVVASMVNVMMYTAFNLFDIPYGDSTTSEPAYSCSPRTTDDWLMVPSQDDDESEDPEDRHDDDDEHEDEHDEHDEGHEDEHDKDAGDDQHEEEGTKEAESKPLFNGYHFALFSIAGFALFKLVYSPNAPEAKNMKFIDALAPFVDSHTEAMNNIHMSMTEDPSVGVAVQLRVPVETPTSTPSPVITEPNLGLKTTQEGNVDTAFHLAQKPSKKQFYLALFNYCWVMICCYFTGYLEALPMSPRHWNADRFLFAYVAPFLIAPLTIRKVENTDRTRLYLNRAQTTSWKGMMQVGFLLYHYYHGSTAVYKLIRVFVAAYVWMTGFGHFSYFWVREDYSFGRQFKNLFRLNLLSVLFCGVIERDWMLYYICCLHTYWTIIPYLFFAIYKKRSPRIFFIKFVVLFAFSFIVFDLPRILIPDTTDGGLIFKIFNAPIYPFVRYKQAKWTPLHEWWFRGGLDHYVAPLGMLTAYFHPHISKWLVSMDNLVLQRRSPSLRFQGYLKKLAVSMAAIVALILWYFFAYKPYDKYAYNARHPYFSIIPIWAFIVLRNISLTARKHYLKVFHYCGRITLETYLLQHYLFLAQDAKAVLRVLPEEYVMMNFAIVGAFFLLSSYVTYRSTLTIFGYLFTNDGRTPMETKPLLRAIAKIGGILVTLVLIGTGLAYLS